MVIGWRPASAGRSTTGSLTNALGSSIRSIQRPRDICREFATETNPATLKVLLKVRERDGYWWVECGSCEAGWQVPFYAESIGARR